MKQAITMMFAAVFLLSAPKAEAGEPGPGPQDMGLQFDNPATAQCVAQCLKQQPAAKPAPKKVVKRKRVRRPKRQVRRKSYCPPCCLVLKAEVARIKVRVDKLSDQVGLLAGRDLTPELNRLKGRLDRLEKAMKGLARQGDLDRLRKDLESLRDQVSLLSRNESPIRLSPVGGFVGFYSLDGSSYTAGALGLRVASNFTAEVEVGFEGLALVSGGERHFGTQARGFLGWNGFSRVWSAELGFSATWGGYSAQAEAQSLFVSGDLGLTALVYESLWLHARVNLGAEMDKGSPDFALGGLVSIGYEF